MRRLRSSANRRTLPATALVLAAALTASACGSRLDDEQRAVAIAAPGVAAPAAGGGAVAPGVDAGVGAGVGTTDSDAPGVDAGAAGGGESSAGGEVAGPGAAEPGAAEPGEPAAPGAAADTRAAPPGGNGGATDVGVTEDQITIFNVADVSGAVPGIFQDAQLAMQAYVAMFTATEGTIYGRQLNLVVRDSQLNASQNRSHYQDACQQALAAVGSMSAFDEGVAGPVSECNLPDLRTTAVNPVTINTAQVYSADSISSDVFPTNHFLYWDETHPGIKEAAGMLYINNDTTTQQTRLVKAATEKVGYVWKVDEAIGLAETNYSSFVIKLKNEGVEFVFFQGDVAQAVRLAQAMRQQNYWPTVYALQQNLYSQKLLAQGGADIEGAEVAAATALIEQIDAYPELQKYREWLKRISPDAEPSGQGIYSWAAGMVFTDCLKAIGPNVTRQAVLDCYAGVQGFEANGIIPPQDIGAKTPTNCHIIVRVEGGQFVPIDPQGGLGYECRGQNQSG